MARREPPSAAGSGSAAAVTSKKVPPNIVITTVCSPLSMNKSDGISSQADMSPLTPSSLSRSITSCVLPRSQPIAIPSSNGTSSHHHGHGHRHDLDHDSDVGAGCNNDISSKSSSCIDIHDGHTIRCVAPRPLTSRMRATLIDDTATELIPGSPSDDDSHHHHYHHHHYCTPPPLSPLMLSDGDISRSPSPVHGEPNLTKLLPSCSPPSPPMFQLSPVSMSSNELADMAATLARQSSSRQSIGISMPCAPPLPPHPRKPDTTRLNQSTLSAPITSTSCPLPPSSSTPTLTARDTIPYDRLLHSRELVTFKNLPIVKGERVVCFAVALSAQVVVVTY
jgi:hypothetical protein